VAGVATGALVLGAPGCGGDAGAAKHALAHASDRLARLRSGDVAFSLQIEPVGPGPDVQVQGRGSFAAPRPGVAPRLVVYTNDNGTTTRTVTRAGAPLRRLRLDEWVNDPQLVRGGLKTDHVHGRLAADTALEDISAFAEPLFAGLLADDAPSLASAVRSGSVDVWIDRRDPLVRRMLITADVGLDVPEGVAAALGRPLGAALRLELELRPRENHA